MLAEIVEKAAKLKASRGGEGREEKSRRPVEA